MYCTHRTKSLIRGTVKIQLWCVRSIVHKFMLRSCCSDRTGLCRIRTRQCWQNGGWKWEWTQSHVVRSTWLTPGLQNRRYGHPGPLIWCRQYDSKKCIFHFLLINNTAVPWLLPYFGVWRHVFYWFVYGLTTPSVALVTQRRITERRLDGNSEVLKLNAAGSINTLAPKYQILLEDLWTIWSCCLYVFYEYYCHNPSYSLGSIFYQCVYGFIPV